MDEQPSSSGPPDPSALPTSMAVTFYLGMLFVTLVWAALTEPGFTLLTRAPQPFFGLPWWGLGGAVGAALVVATWLAEPRWPAMARLSAELRASLGPRSLGDVLVLAVASGVVEEALFRGVMHHSLGYVLTSLIFALMHGGPSRRYYAWTTFALIAGLSFGLLAEAYQSIWPAALAHVVVNGINLRRLTRVQPSERV